MKMRDWFYAGILHEQQVYTVRVGSIAVSLKGAKCVPLFSERYRINCAVLPLLFGYRLTLRWRT